MMYRERSERFHANRSAVRAFFATVRASSDEPCFASLSKTTFFEARCASAPNEEKGGTPGLGFEPRIPKGNTLSRRAPYRSAILARSGVWEGGRLRAFVSGQAVPGRVGERCGTDQDDQRDAEFRAEGDSLAGNKFVPLQEDEEGQSGDHA